jgi:hypothetical protein
MEDQIGRASNRLWGRMMALCSVGKPEEKEALNVGSRLILKWTLEE